MKFCFWKKLSEREIVEKYLNKQVEKGKEFLVSYSKKVSNKVLVEEVEFIIKEFEKALKVVENCEFNNSTLITKASRLPSTKIEINKKQEEKL